MDTVASSFAANPKAAIIIIIVIIMIVFFIFTHSFYLSVLA
jgi:hypothetical protein